MGQAFFSLSITGSGMIVYGAYLNKSADIPAASLRTALFDTLAAMLSALAIMPAVFAFGIDPTSGPSLLFITLPGIFREIPMGSLFAVFFFVSVAFAGITSLINMFEAVAESWQSHFKLGRKTAVLICSALTLGVGIFMESEARVGSWMDFWLSKKLALITATAPEEAAMDWKLAGEFSFPLLRVDLTDTLGSFIFTVITLALTVPEARA